MGPNRFAAVDLAEIIAAKDNLASFNHVEVLVVRTSEIDQLGESNPGYLVGLLPGALRDLQVALNRLADAGVEFVWRFDEKIHDRELRTDTGWSIRIGRGLDIYQRTETWIQIGATNLNVRPCMETKVSIIKVPVT